nr:LytTR family DNA-binding domain-containing protein [Bacteroidales bacterium]
VFLVIQMDKKNGVALLKEIKELSVDSHIVITSGYDDYTFEAFKNGAFDYLIKPIVVEELEKVIFRIDSAREELKISSLGVDTTNNAKEQPTKIRTSNEQGYLLAHDILYLKASGSYTEIYCQGGHKEICTRGLWLLERELPEYCFKIHRSTVVNTRYIQSLQIESQLCVIANEDCTHELPISKANIASLEAYLHAR